MALNAIKQNLKVKKEITRIALILTLQYGSHFQNQIIFYTCTLDDQNFKAVNPLRTSIKHI